MAQSYAPFSCTYSREVPDILENLNCSLALTTYQAGKVILLSPSGDDGLVQLTRNFRRPMGLAADGDRIAVATGHEVVVLENAPSLARAYPRRPGYYDAMFLPRMTLYSGAVDLHDMAWGSGHLWAVNTLFSCVCHVGGNFSFVPVWKPPFVSRLAPEDRCHLNGMAMHEGRPRYVTALGAADEPKGWRADRLGGGVVIETESGEIVVSGLAMPHSPRIYDGELYLLSSATGELLRADVDSGTSEVISRVPGFARGLARHGDYLFIAHSRLRKKHAFGDLPIASTNPVAGVTLLHLPSGRIAGGITYLASCEEIYDVQVIPGYVRPGILSTEDERHRMAVHFPRGGLWATSPESQPEGAVQNGAVPEA